jgi:hypothetical protein
MLIAIIEYNLIYNIKNVADNQLQVKGTNFLIQLNDKGLLGKITMLIIKQFRLRMIFIKNYFIKEIILIGS